MRRTPVLSRMPARRWVASALTLVLTAGLMVAVQPPAPAAAAGPSVELPKTASVPVTAQSMASRPTDPATAQAVEGNQPAGGSQGDGAGTPTATSLSPSATWNVSTHTGDFQWSYPLRVPPVPGELVPNLALSYRSSAVDGRTSATNNQPSWVGDGWDLNPGFVERTYGSCADDEEGTKPPNNGDLCWRSDNATAMYGGGGGMLVRDDGTGQWRPQQDDGARIQRLTGGGNGDENGEHWKVTTVDGTQYFFGSRPAAKSTWTVPVYGDDAGEPCHGSSFAGSRCPQAWRWNLDKVVDAKGNVILLSYETETNSYGANLQDTAVSYVRGGYLRRIEYGLHTSAASTPAARVEFTVADRCVRGSTCTLNRPENRPENWPDTPLDQRCVTTTCKDHYFPTFWSTKRLATITTQVRKDGQFVGVDRWTLGQEFPNPGDGEKPALWLKSITHTGLVGGEASLPPVTFEGAAMPNRVYQADGLSPLLRYRIIGVVSESGGVISVEYADPDCVPGQSMPANAHTNTRRCFPVTWNRPGFAERTDWFHKYVVKTVSLSDRISSSLDQRVSYQYLDGAAWRYDTSEFTPDDKRTWNEFRGYARVRVRNGRSDDPAGPISMTEQRFYRGMHGDRSTPTGGTRSVSVTDSEGGTHADRDWLSGLERESITYLGESATVVTKTLTDPVWQGPTATRDQYRAYLVRPGTERTFTTLAAGRRETKLTTSFDDRGLPTVVNDLGDVGTAADDLCTRTSYVRNTTAWLLSAPSRVQTVSRHCGANPTFPDHAVSDQRLSHDGQGWGAAPRAGNVTKVEVLERHPASGPGYAVESTARYDDHGRVTESTDALGRTNRTAYTPALGGPTTRTVVTGPMGFTTTTDLEPAFGQPKTVTDVNDNTTDTAYDPLGRVSEVWLPDRARKWGFESSYRFSYLIRREAPTVVTTTRIGPNGNYTSANELYDGLLRLRQVQAPAVGGGRLLTDTRYDGQGRAYKTTNPYFNNAPVDTTLWVASDVEIPGHTLTEFDGAGRPVASVLMAGAVPKWRTTTRYGGDRVSVTPPPGGTATTTVYDARERVVALHQYHGGSASGPADVTEYTYTPVGQLATVTDPAGNTWRYRYDLRGRQVWNDDPDKGEASYTYDAAGQLTGLTDARGQVVTYDYDDLGRVLSIRSGGADGRPLAEWTYDTVRNAKGQPATATSYDADGNAYTSAVLTYTARYQPRKTSVTIPESEGLLAGTYLSGASYNPDGSKAGETYPEAGGLFAEEVHHTYDDVGRPLTTYGGPDGTTVMYASDTVYTRYGEMQRLQLGSGTKRAWLSHYYDGPTRRVERTIVDAELPRPMQADLHYSYDPAGNLTSIADTPLERPADIQCFRYDYLRRLTEAWTPGGDPGAACTAAPDASALAGPAPYWQSFGYDLVGNRRTQVERTPAGGTSRSYAYPDPGAARPHALTSVTTAGVGKQDNDYDAAGNTTSLGDLRLAWDELGRLATATEDGETTSYVYDAAGERLIRRDPGGSTLYLGNQEIRLDRATGTLTGTRYYAHGGGTIAVRTESSGVIWLFADHHGTAGIAVDSASLTATVRRHDPFGNLRGAAPATWPDEKGFVGGTTGESTGLTHLGAREYDPRHGRFISVDPVIDPIDPQQMNAYAYANNNPVSMSDPDGRFYYVDRDGHVRAPSAKGWTPAAKKRVKQQTAKWRPVYQRETQQKSTRFKASGYTPEQYAEAKKIQQKSVFDVAIEAGGEILAEFLGINDIKNCFGNGDVGACISMVVNIIPWSKLFRLGELLGAVKKAWNAVTSFRGQQKRANKIIDAVENACSFSGDTEVLMADGTHKPISDVEPGDRVLATDPETGEQSAQTVTAVWVHEDTLVDLAVDRPDELTEGTSSGVAVTVTTTDDHSFWNHTDQQWQPASTLEPGDRLLAADGSQTTVVGLLTYTEHEAPAYNLTVANLHTYYVTAGDTPVLVHNEGPACDLPGHSGRHQFPGVGSGKSQFYDDANLNALSNTDGVPGVVQKNGNTRYVMHGRNEVGVDRTTGLPTNVYTVIRKPDGSVLTLFPGTSPMS